MLRNFKRFTLQVVAGANLATIFMMLFVGFSDRFNPVNHQVLANAGLVFPVSSSGFASRRRELCFLLRAILCAMCL